MTFEGYFPVWDQLSENQRNRLLAALTLRTAKKGDILHRGGADCTGLFIIQSGQLRAYILSDEGRQITLYRLFDRDICLFSASCILRSIQFDITIEAQKDTVFWVIPAEIYQQIVQESTELSNYTNEIMAGRFSEVMWLMEQVMWKSLDKRLAAFLMEESSIEGGPELKITHEIIANHLGTHREVITRMLRYFQEEGLVALSRGTSFFRDSPNRPPRRLNS